MRSHGDIQGLLYDFAMGELGAEETEAVRLHLRSCRECSDAVRELEQLVEVVPRTPERPSDRVDDAHWADLAARIEKNLPPAPARRTVPPLTIRERFRLFVPAHRPAVALVLAVLVLAITGTLVLIPRQAEEPVLGSGAERTATEFEPAATVVADDADIAAHLRRSKSLLVGLTNRPLDEAIEDLTVEREASRRLLTDNRRYRLQVLDPQSSEVLADLEKIMIEVANSRDQAPAADLDLIRQGIRQQNLLFKVRIAERLSSRGMIVRTSGE